jgi:hypothetical protein
MIWWCSPRSDERLLPYTWITAEFVRMEAAEVRTGISQTPGDLPRSSARQAAASGMYYAEFVAAAVRELLDAPDRECTFGEWLAFTSGR